MNERNDRGNLERMGESAGAMAGRAADWGMEMTGSLVRSAAEMLGGWWSGDEPRQAASAWSDRAEQNCRSHFQGAASGSASGAGASGSVGGTTQATGKAPKSPRGAMQSAGELHTDTGRAAGSASASAGDGGTQVAGSARIGDTEVSGAARMETSSNRERTSAPDSASDGFERARPGYQFGYVARQNPAYRGRSFGEVEPELKRVWESGAKTRGESSQSGSSWPEVRGFVDFAYQQGDATDR